MRLLLILSALVLAIGCNDGTKIVVDHPLPESGWSSSDIIHVDHEETSPIYLRVSHSADYGYENLYIRVTSDTAAQVISIPLMNEEGLWTGTSKGESFITDYRMKALDKAATYKIEQYARTPVLPSITSIQVITKTP